MFTWGFFRGGGWGWGLNNHVKKLQGKKKKLIDILLALESRSLHAV